MVDVAVKRNRILRTVVIPLLRLTNPIIDLRHLTRAFLAYPAFIRDARRYAALPGSEPLEIANLYPQLFDRTPVTHFDSHYFYVNGWAMRRITANRPRLHVDIGSQILFSNLLGAVVPTVFVDYRPLVATLDGLTSVGGSILDLPFRPRSLASISCLHVAEHIGLGRYGDPLDPAGTAKAAAALADALAPDGDLYFALPVGRPRVEFNAHRIHAHTAILDLFPSLDLAGFAAVLDDGRFVEPAESADLEGQQYACGMYWFHRPTTS